MLVSFFGTGNIASISSFDPNWVRCLVATFSPFLMASLIILKLMIPVLVVMCAVRQIHSITKVISVSQLRKQNIYLFRLISIHIFVFAYRFTDSTRQIFHHYFIVLWYYVPEFSVSSQKYWFMVGNWHINITFCNNGGDRCGFVSNSNFCQISNHIPIAITVAVWKNTRPQRRHGENRIKSDGPIIILFILTMLRYKLYLLLNKYQKNTIIHKMCR